MQAAFQKFTDSAVSKTVNFPHDATREDVARVYMLAYHEGLKGITIYRDGSRDGQVLTVGDGARKTEGGLLPRERPKVTRGVTERVSTGCGYIYVTVNFDDQGIFEVFATLGKAGGCAAAQLEAISRLISLALRSGIEVDSIVRHLRGIRCPFIAWEKGHAVLSCADAIASVLQKYGDGRSGGSSSDSEMLLEQDTPIVSDNNLVNNDDTTVIHASSGLVGQCPDCGATLVYQEGCSICPNCGFTKCE